MSNHDNDDSRIDELTVNEPAIKREKGQGHVNDNVPSVENIDGNNQACKPVIELLINEQANDESLTILAVTVVCTNLLMTSALSEVIMKHDYSSMSAYLNNVVEWSDHNLMNINVAKTKEMLLGRIDKEPPSITYLSKL